MPAKRLYLFIFVFLTTALFAGSVLAQSASNTPRPTPTPSTTPVPFIQLPDWIRDPDTAVVALFLSNDPYSGGEVWTLINAETGERFPLELTYVDEIGWVDAQDGVYLQLMRYQSSGADNSEGFNEYVDLVTGRLVRLPFGDARIPMPPTAAPPGADNGSNFNYQLIAQAEWRATNSEATSYQLQAGGNVIVSNIETGEILLDWDVSHPLTIQWFANGRYLGMGYTQTFFDGDQEVVTIVDIENGEFNQVAGVGQPRWSANHTLMLYRDLFEQDTICVMDAENPYRQYADCDLFGVWSNQSDIRDYHWSSDGQRIFFTYTRNEEQAGGLCVIEMGNRTIDCPIQRTMNNGTFQSSYRYASGAAFAIYSYRNVLVEGDHWDPDIPHETGLCLISQTANNVDCFTEAALPEESYVNWTSLSPSNQVLAVLHTSQIEARRQGVCFANLQSGDITCPDSSEIEGYIEGGAWSPDSRFFLAMYTAYGPGSDDKSATRYAIFDAADGSYIDVGYANYEIRLDGLWRPY